MGNLCSCCFNNQDASQTNGNFGDNYSGINNSQNSLSPTEPTDRTPLLYKPGKGDGSSGNSLGFNSQQNVDPSTSSSAIVPQGQLSNESRQENTAIHETAETKMACIVEGMLSKLIDVGSGGAGIQQLNSSTTNLNTQNDQLKQILTKSFSSSKLSSLPDAGLNNLPSLLSGRPISSEICHFVAHTASELSRLLIDEIKIIHKEDLVVVFE